MTSAPSDDDGHTIRFGWVALFISSAELISRIIGADAGRDDPMIVLGLVALVGASILLLREDDRGRTGWILSGLIMTLYAIARVLLFGHFIQTALLAVLGIALALAAEQTLRPASLAMRGPLVARLVRRPLYDYLLIPLAVVALWPFGVSLNPQGAIAASAADEGFRPKSEAQITANWYRYRDGTYAYTLPNGCTVSAIRTVAFWHPGPVSCAGRHPVKSDSG
ncbi:MAG: hypothetical protein ABR548_04240 [Actinomycetota bacterium]|nr:hypothetical protein [Actinomycetota bacterium]